MSAGVTDQLLGLFKLLLLALIWLFFLRVLRTVWLEVASPAVAGAASGVVTDVIIPDEVASGSVDVPYEMLLLAPPELAGQRHSLAKEVSMGRASSNDVVINDTYASQRHARCFEYEGQIVVEDLGSTNGTLVNGHPLTGPTILSVGDQIAIGETLLEMR